MYIIFPIFNIGILMEIILNLIKIHIIAIDNF